MTEPTDRERAAKALYSVAGAGARIPWEQLSIGGDTRCRWLNVAGAAMALGAKPPVDPVDELAASAYENWCRTTRHIRLTFDDLNDEAKEGWRTIVRHVLARAKKLDLS